MIIKSRVAKLSSGGYKGGVKISCTRFAKRSAAGLICCAAVLSSCTPGGPGDEQDLAEALNRNDVYTEQEAACIAKRVFEEYGADKDTIEEISNADSTEDLQSVPGFIQDFESYQSECSE